MTPALPAAARAAAPELASCMDTSEWLTAIALRRDRLIARARGAVRAEPKRQAEIDMLGLMYRAVRAFDLARHNGEDLTEFMRRIRCAEQVLVPTK